MTAHWLVYCVGTAGLLGLAAWAAERALRLGGWASRWVWAGALAASLLVPAAAWLRPLQPVPAPAESPSPAPEILSAAVWAQLPVTPTEDTGSGWRDELPRVERMLAPLWTLSSAGMLVLLLASAATVHRHRRGWRMARLDGVPVRVSARTGPAVVGFRKSEIVVPEWATHLEPRLRALMIAHEQEHLRAGDPRLLLAALLAVAAMPWNPALWWQLRRLRLAVEADCDARVLRRGADVRSYGVLLLEVGRRSAGLPLLAAALSEPTSFLERRIRIMTASRPRVAWLRAVGSAAGAALLIVAACESPRPTPLAPLEVHTASIPPGLSEMTEESVEASIALNRKTRDRQAVARHFPSVLTEGMQGNGTLVFVANLHGEVLAMGAGADLSSAFQQVQGVGAGPGSPRGIKNWRPKPNAKHPVSVQQEQYPAGALAPDSVEVVWIQPGVRFPTTVNDTVELIAVGPRGASSAGAILVLPQASGAASDTTVPKLLNAAEITRLLAANYPPLLRDAGVTGGAVVEIQIGADGQVRNVSALEASHEQFGDAAARTAREMRFRPARVDGRPVPYTAVQPITFNLPLLDASASGDARRLPTLDTRGVTGAYGTGDSAIRRWAPLPLASVRQQTEEMRRQSEEMQARSKEMQLRSQEMQQRSREMRAQHERMQAVIRSELPRRHPNIAEEGLREDRYVWFIANAAGEVTRSGIAPIDRERGGSWSTRSVERQLHEAIPGIRIANIAISMGMDVGAPGGDVNAAWVTVEDGASLR